MPVNGEHFKDGVKVTNAQHGLQFNQRGLVAGNYRAD